MSRPDGRSSDELRPITFERDFTEMSDGSCLVTVGRTKVLCTASIDEDVPRWMKGEGQDGSPLNTRCFPGRRQSVSTAKRQKESSLDALSKSSGSSHEHFGPRATCRCSANAKWLSTVM